MAAHFIVPVMNTRPWKWRGQQKDTFVSVNFGQFKGSTHANLTFLLEISLRLVAVRDDQNAAWFSYTFVSRIKVFLSFMLLALCFIRHVSYHLNVYFD